jgi:hypothetical protein
MAQLTPDLLSELEIAAMLARDKTLLGDLIWEEKPNNTAFITFNASLLDETGATIPGLTLVLSVRLGMYEHDCRLDFGIFQFKGGKRQRAYQINVRPWDKSSHTEPNGEIWYGPHEHIGARAQKFPNSVQLGCSDHEEWFKLFLVNANIKFGGKYYPPVQARLI